jgi:excinuclease ABC subunit A
MILYGGKEKFSKESKTLGITREFKIDFEGVATFIETTYNNNDSASLRRWAKEYMDKITCPTCEGSRLKNEALFFKLNDQNIAELANKDITDLASWFENLDQKAFRKTTANSIRGN